MSQSVTGGVRTTPMMSLRKNNVVLIYSEARLFPDPAGVQISLYDASTRAPLSRPTVAVTRENTPWNGCGLLGRMRVNQFETPYKKEVEGRCKSSLKTSREHQIQTPIKVKLQDKTSLRAKSVGWIMSTSKL